MPGAVIRSDTFRLEIECPTVVQRRHIYLCPGESFDFGEETITWDTVFVDSIAAQTERVCDSLDIFVFHRYIDYRKQDPSGLLWNLQKQYTKRSSSLQYQHSLRAKKQYVSAETRDD